MEGGYIMVTSLRINRAAWSETLWNYIAFKQLKLLAVYKFKRRFMYKKVLFMEPLRMNSPSHFKGIDDNKSKAQPMHSTMEG